MDDLGVEVDVLLRECEDLALPHSTGHAYDGHRAVLAIVEVDDSLQLLPKPGHDLSFRARAQLDTA